jgi:hypothetical protein
MELGLTNRPPGELQRWPARRAGGTEGVCVLLVAWFVARARSWHPYRPRFP